MSVVSQVLIANMALSNIGTKSEIASLDENSVEAKQCKLWYDLSRKQALEAFDWGFARKRLTLALHADDAAKALQDLWFRQSFGLDGGQIFGQLVGRGLLASTRCRTLLGCGHG